MKIISILCLVGVGVVTIACANLKDNAPNSVSNITPKTTAKWQARAPQLFKNVGYGKLIESNVNMSIPASQSELAGVITNPFGIRDDILEFILNAVPQDNELALRASVKIAQDMQKIYYANLSQKEAMQLANNEIHTKICLIQYLPDNKDLIITRGVDKMMRDTQSRDKRMWELDAKYFGWQVEGSDLSVADENKACKEGKF